MNVNPTRIGFLHHSVSGIIINSCCQIPMSLKDLRDDRHLKEPTASRNLPIDKKLPHFLRISQEWFRKTLSPPGFTSNYIGGGNITCESAKKCNKRGSVGPNNDTTKMSRLKWISPAGELLEHSAGCRGSLRHVFDDPGP